MREAVRATWRELTDLIGGVAGVTDEEFADFFAKGMLMTMLDAMQVFTDRTPWGDRLIAGCPLEEVRLAALCLPLFFRCDVSNCLLDRTGRS